MTGKCGAVLSYGDAMHPSAVTNNSATGKNYTYDNNGNMLNRGIQSMSWNIDNRVMSIAILGGGTANMEYDYAGQRMIKNATTTGIALFPFQGYEIAPDRLPSLSALALRPSPPTKAQINSSTTTITSAGSM